MNQLRKKTKLRMASFQVATYFHYKTAYCVRVEFQSRVLRMSHKAKRLE